MKYIAALIALAASATAQSVTACDGKAQSCLDDAVKSTGICSVGDWACGCANMDAIQGAGTSCVLTACGGATGALAVLTEVQNICANLPAAGASSPPASEPSPPAESSPANDAGSAAPTSVAAAEPTTMATAVLSTGAAVPTGSYSGPVVNGAGAAGPIMGVLLGAAALAF